MLELIYFLTVKMNLNVLELLPYYFLKHEADCTRCFEDSTFGYVEHLKCLNISNKSWPQHHKYLPLQS